MTQELATQDQSHRAIIKDMYFRGASDAEFEAFLMLCKKTGLDPIAKQIYVMKSGGKLVTMTSIDGQRLVAERTGKYAPGREPTYTYDAKGKLISATSYVKKRTSDGSWHEVAATAHLVEFGKDNQIWKQMPHIMLAKCAESQALRRAFPNDLSGLYSREEMEQANIEEVASEQKKEPKLMSKPATVEATVQEVPSDAQNQRTIDDLVVMCADFGVKIKKLDLLEYVLNLRDAHNTKTGKNLSDADIVQSAFLMPERFVEGLEKYLAQPEPVEE